MAHYHNRSKRKEALIVLGIFALFLLCVLLADTADSPASDLSDKYSDTGSTSAAGTAAGAVSTTAPTAKPTSGKGTVSSSESSRLPNVPADLKNHYFFRNRMKNSCNALTGKVAATFIFYSDKENTWNTSAITAQKKAIEEDISLLEQAAAKQGATLDMTAHYREISGESMLSMSATVADRSAWLLRLFEKLGLGSSLAAVTNTLKRQYIADETPVLLLYAGRGRAYANTANDGFEVAILYQNSDSFLHELCHMFGAVDYYRPDWVNKIFDRYYAASIMDDSTQKANGFDSLTCYLIGWTNQLAPKAENFLRETIAVNADSYTNEAGYSTGEVVYVSGNRYVGEKYDGLPHGTGTMYYTDGGVYTGTFDHGTMHGQGTFKYGNGTVYTGTFVNGKEHGQGTLTYTSGTVYTGSFVNSKLQGQGTMKYPDGGTYVGDFANDKRHGQGTMRYGNGNVYTGSFADGKLHGQGTLTYASGTVYTGSFVNGKLHGQGTMKYSNGDVYVGGFAEDKRHGQGTYTYKDGSVKQGTWVNSTFQG